MAIFDTWFSLGAVGKSLLLFLGHLVHKKIHLHKMKWPRKLGIRNYRNLHLTWETQRQIFTWHNKDLTYQTPYITRFPLVIQALHTRVAMYVIFLTLAKICLSLFFTIPWMSVVFRVQSWTPLITEKMLLRNLIIVEVASILMNLKFRRLLEKVTGKTPMMDFLGLVRCWYIVYIPIPRGLCPCLPLPSQAFLSVFCPEDALISRGVQGKAGWACQVWDGNSSGVKRL